MGIRTIGAHSLRLAIIAAGLSLVGSAFAQNTPASASPPSTPPNEDEGTDVGGYHVTQSIELGGRISEVNGSQPMYDTLVNQQTGARILDQSFTMQSLTHHDILDTLTLNSFGWGGDPEQAARLRIAKWGWYTFSGSYQHMQNYFDYNLLANPLNPPTGSPFIPILTSPHSFYNRHNLYNFDLVVLPKHRVSFRVDYNRNRISGPSFLSVSQGTEALTSENSDSTLNGYRFGADFRVNQKTTLSYTQLLQYHNDGSTYALNPFNSLQLSNGTSVTFGLPWFNGGSPCAAPVTNGIANPVCNGFFTYSLYQHVNTFIPTEQINLASSSLKWLDFSGQYQYSHANSNTPLTEIFTGLITRTGNLGYSTAGSSSSAKWNSSSADLSATIHVNDQLRLVDTFRFRNFSVAGTFLNQTTSSFNAASSGPASLLNPIATFPSTLLFHSNASPPDITNEINVNQTAQNMKQNDFQVQYDVSQLFGVRAGFVWTRNVIQPGNSFQASLGDIFYPNIPNRGNCVGVPLNADGSCTFTGVLTPWGNPTTEINRFSAVLGTWFRKGSSLHGDFNAQFGGADNWIYRTDPTTFFNITGNGSYAPRPWLMLGGNFMFQQGQNNSSDINYKQHNYVTMVNATITPGEHWGLDLAYNFNAIQQNSILCFTGAVVPPGSIPCQGDNTLMQTNGVYQTHTQYGYFALTLTPVERLTVRLGYNIVDNQGNTSSFNTLLPLGPLASTYQSPLAAVDVKLHKNVTFKAGWNYYQYNENSFVGPTAPRYFHANNTTLALRYAF